jgi:hypothetical protein
MAYFEVNLRNALVAALRADTAFASVMGDSAGTKHIEGGDQPDLFLSGAAGHAWCRPASQEELESSEDSARTRFRFEVLIQLVDLRGLGEFLGATKQGLRNTLKDKGAAIFATYLTDTHSNRLGGSGEWTLEDLALVPFDQLQDADRPELLATVACELWHKSPLVSA